MSVLFTAMLTMGALAAPIASQVAIKEKPAIVAQSDNAINPVPGNIEILEIVEADQIMPQWRKDYINESETVFNSKWKPRDKKSSVSVGLDVNVSRSGRIKDVKVLNSAGEKEDKRAVSRIKHVRYLKPLPVEVVEDTFMMPILLKYSPMDKEYMLQLKKMVVNNTSVLTSYISRRVDVKITLDRSGKLLNINIIKTSGNPDFDNAVINILKNMSYPTFPENSSFGDKGVFECHVYSKLIKK